MFETVIDDGAIESRRYDEVGSGFPCLLGLPDVEHGTHSSEHLGLLLRDAPQRLESAGSAKSDLCDRKPTGQERGGERHRVLRLFDYDHWNDTPAPERFRYHRLLDVH